MKLKSLIIFLLCVLMLCCTKAQAQGVAPPYPVGVLASSVPGISTPYLGQVATRASLALSNSTSSHQMQTRTTHRAMSNISSLQIVIPNFYYPSAVETGTGAAASVTASVEYPSGTIHRIKFSGSNTGSIASGTFLTSDPVAVTIPYGASFFIRIWFSNSAMIIFQSPGGGILMSTDGFEFGATTPDLTGGGAVGVAFNSEFFPAAIIAQTTRPTVCLVGDSRVEGYQDSVNVSGGVPYDVYGDVGEFARNVGPSLGYISLGVGGDTALGASTTFTKRLALSAYCSHVLINYGINDVNNGESAATLIAAVNTLIALFPTTEEVWVATVAPNSNSTDSWATVTNQSVTAGNAARVTYNTAVRTGFSIVGARGYLELAGVVESSLNSGLWQAPGYTIDGIHENPLATVKLQSSNFIPVWSFSR